MMRSLLDLFVKAKRTGLCPVAEPDQPQDRRGNVWRHPRGRSVEQGKAFKWWLLVHAPDSADGTKKRIRGAPWARWMPSVPAGSAGTLCHVSDGLLPKHPHERGDVASEHEAGSIGAHG